jgi:hypothetical protein
LGEIEDDNLAMARNVALVLDLWNPDTGTKID